VKSAKLALAGAVVLGLFEKTIFAVPHDLTYLFSTKVAV